MKKIIRYASAFILMAFGLLTLFLSTSVIFDLFGIREMEGNYVLFIVWANFISSGLYLFSAYGFFKQKKWTTILLGISLLILTVAYFGLKNHITTGGLYELKTVNAMIFRTSVSLIFTTIAYFLLTKSKTTL